MEGRYGADPDAAGSRLLIATHAPILMAIPGATMLSFDAVPVERVAFGELE